MTNYTLTIDGLGSKFWIKLYFENEIDYINEVKSEIIKQIEDFEQLYSRFIPTSLVGKLNQGLCITPTKELFEMLEYACVCQQLTCGYFNIFIGEDLVRNGYGVVQSKNTNSNFIQTTAKGFEYFSQDKIQLYTGCAIDLGGFGKGWIIKKLANYLKNKFNIYKGYINGGGDILAWNEINHEQFRFYLDHPTEKDTMIGYIEIKNSALASSGNKFRTWSNEQGQKQNHLINPFNSILRDNDGEDFILSSTFVQGFDIVNVDVASTSLFVSNGQIAKTIQLSMDISYLLIKENGSYFQSLNYPGVLF